MSQITQETTVKELIELGLFESGLIDVWNSRLEKREKKSEKSVQVSQVSEFILQNLQDGMLYKTGNFIKPVIENFPSFVEGEKTDRDKAVLAHKIITSALKSLVESDKLVVVNTTNNHAHNRYALKPNLEEVPTFVTNV